MSKIKCIIFDWGGVLIKNPAEDFATECAKSLGTDVEKLKTAYSKFVYQFERGLIEESVLWQKMGEELNIKIQSTNSLWYDCFKKIYSPRKEIFDLAKQLKNNGYLVALLSNTEVPTMNYFNEQNYDMFDYKVFSCVEGEAKPEPALYKIMLNKINIPAEQTIFIDDKLENVKTAAKLGINAFQYIDNKTLLLNLKEFKVIL